MRHAPGAALGDKSIFPEHRSGGQCFPVCTGGSQSPSLTVAFSPPLQEKLCLFLNGYWREGASLVLQSLHAVPGCTGLWATGTSYQNNMASAPRDLTLTPWPSTAFSRSKSKPTRQGGHTDLGPKKQGRKFILETRILGQSLKWFALGTDHAMKLLGPGAVAYL